MSERNPLSGPSQLPRLPQGKSADEILKLPPDEFDQAAKDANFASPEAFRDMLSKTAAGAAEWKARQEQSIAPAPEEHTRLIREAVRSGLSRLYFDDVERDLSVAERLTDEADALIKKMEASVDSKERTRGQLKQTAQRATTLYTRAYQIRAMHDIDELIAAGNNRKDAVSEVLRDLERRGYALNLEEEARAIRRVANGLYSQLSEQVDEMRDLYRAIKSGSPLDHTQELQFQKLVAEAKGVVFRGRHASARYGGVQGAVAQAMREADIWKTEVDGTSGSAEYFSVGSVAGSAYSRHSRPRRDMHGSSGGDNDK